MDAKVSQFVAITGASREVAMRLLEACGNNLDLAINMHLESGGSPVPAVAGPSSEASSGTADSVLSPKSYEELYGVRAPIPQTRGVLVEDTLPRKVLRSRRLPQTVFDPFQDYSKAAGSSSLKLPGPGSDAEKKTLAELFKPPHEIMFHGSFHEARLAGEHRQKWLLVNVQDSREFASQVLNRDVWSNHNVKDVIRDSFVFWQIHRITDDGIKFKQLYHIETFPYIAVIDPRTGEKMANWNSLSVSEFITVIQEFLATHHYDDGDHRLLGSEKSSVVELSEQSQLEAAIQASLQDCHPASDATKRRSKYELVFSDSEDDPLSLSSDAVSDMDETDEGWMGSANVMDDAVGLAHTSTSNSLTPLNSASSTVKLKQCERSVLEGDVEESQPELSRKKRKRTSSHLSIQYENPRKVLRSNTTKNNEIHYPVRRSQNQWNSACSKSQESLGSQQRSKNQKKKIFANGAQEQTGLNSSSNTTSVACIDVEKLLETGAIRKDEVSHLLFRLPDGTRLQKTFICSHPIKELFDFLQKQGLDMSEHEAVTHFPRRSISEINKTANFKISGLYPRETIFVHTLD